MGQVRCYKQTSRRSPLDHADPEPERLGLGDPAVEAEWIFAALVWGGWRLPAGPTVGPANDGGEAVRLGQGSDHVCGSG